MTPRPLRTLQSPGNAQDAARSRELLELGPWFHNVHLPDGIQTAPDHPLGDFPALLWRRLAPQLPGDLTGARALDVGCNAGFYSVELARRGAEVVALDVDEHYLRQARWVLNEFGLSDRVELRQGQVYDVARWPARETFDLILFMGVFYHLRYPLLALDGLTRRATDIFVFQSLSVPGDEVEAVATELEYTERDRMRAPGWPRLAFIEHELAGDPTNWWLPNRACIQALLRDAGLEPVAQPAGEAYVCRRRGALQPDPRRDAELASAAGIPEGGDRA